MEEEYHNSLNGRIALCRDYHLNQDYQNDTSLYKMLWVRKGTATIEVDHVEMTAGKDEIVPLSPLQRLRFKKTDGEYVMVLFNKNFYCIFAHDNEVSCNGLLFNGGSDVLRLKPDGRRLKDLSQVISDFEEEYAAAEYQREEMLRILLKRFIIICSRTARESISQGQEKEHSLEIIRRYYILVDSNFREKKQVKEYAALLNRSPKTLTNMFSAFSLPSPLEIIHERVDAEAKRLLLYSSKSAKEIADLLGFEDLATFSRFFKRQNGSNISMFRKTSARQD